MKPHLKLYRAISELHNTEAVQSAHQDLFAALEPVFDIEMLPLDALKDAEEIAFLFVATGGVEEGVREAVARSRVSSIYLVADGLQNSLAASMEIAAWLGTKGIGARIVHGAPDDMAHELLSVQRAEALRGCRVGLIGGASGWLISSDIDFGKVGERYGIEFVRIGLDEVI
ncbi:MAG: hypothetical protein K2H74_04225, partial [Paramuribaculum sp.]|nr:hypothetical protein [Paramuribaculum sp.]